MHEGWVTSMSRGYAARRLASLEVALNNLGKLGVHAGAASTDGHRLLYHDAN